MTDTRKPEHETMSDSDWNSVTSEVDPVYVHSRREAIFIFSIWVVFCVYTCAFCYLYGYLSHEPLPTSTGPAIGQIVGPLESFNRDPESLSFPLNLGIPDWVFYGIFLPWLVCIALSIWYGLFFFVEDDLGEADASGEVSA